MVNFLPQVIDVFSPLLGTGYLQKITGHYVIFPFYHTVSDDFLPHVYHVSPYKNVRQFKHDLDYLCRYFEPLHPHELTSSLLSSKKPAFLLSFDDGLSQVFDIIAPILEEKGIPAIFFFYFFFIESENLSFRYKISLIIDRLKNNDNSKNLLDAIYRITEQNQLEKVIHWLRSLDNSTHPLIEKLAQILEIDFSGYYRKFKPYLTQKQVQILADKGFLIGSHGYTHPLFAKLTPEQQWEEISKSMKVITEWVNPPVKTFAFPFHDIGIPLALFKRIQQNQICDFTFGTSGFKKDMAPCHFHRISMERKNLSANRIIKTEYIYFELKKPFGKNLIRRND